MVILTWSCIWYLYLSGNKTQVLKYCVFIYLRMYVYMIKVYAYTYIILHNGLSSAVQVMYKLSAVLSASAVFHDCNSAINDVITKSQQVWTLVGLHWLITSNFTNNLEYQVLLLMYLQVLIVIYRNT